MTTAHITPKALAEHPVVKDLIVLQDQQQLSDPAFVKATRLGYSASAWSRVKAGKYPTTAKILPALQAALDKASSAPSASEDTFVLFDHVNTAIAALDIARATTGPVRLVFFVGTTGCGKTTLANYLREKHDATIVEAAPSWKKSYLASLCDIASQIGLPGEFRSVRAAERALLQTLTAAPRTLVIDEANYFSQDGLNFIKLLLNQPRGCSVVLCTLPGDFNRMLRETAHEANQLVRRAVTIIRVPTVTPKDVVAMQKAAWPSLDLNGHAPKVAEAANRFGRYELVRRILDELQDDPTDVRLAIERAKEHLNTSPIAA